MTVQTQLLALAAAGAPSVTAPPYLAERVLATHRRRRRRRSAGVVLLSGSLAVGLVAARSGGGQFFEHYEPSGSMQPTVQIGGRVVADRTLTAVDQDLVVVRGAYGGQSFTSVRRVMGTAGDRIGCPAGPDGRCRAWVRNGVALVEPYTENNTRDPFATVTVPDGGLFVLGDSRDNAVDSPFYGFLKAADVDGVVVEVVDPDGTRRAVPGAPTHSRPSSGVDTDPHQGPPPASVGS